MISRSLAAEAKRKKWGQRKIHKAEMVKSKNTENDGSARKMRNSEKGVKGRGRTKGRLEHGKVRREKGGRQRNRTKRKRRAQDWKRRK